MTTKNEGRARPQTQGATEPSHDEIRAAYEIHTLAQMMYGQLAAPNPYMAAPPPMPTWGYEAYTPAPTPWVGSWPAGWGYPGPWFR